MIDQNRNFSIREWQERIFQNNVEHGFYEDDRNFGEVLALIHSELSEALEEHRDGHSPTEIYFKGDKPEGVPIEMADALIRVLDWFESHNIDAEYAMRIKHNFNVGRPYKHDKG